MNFRRLGFFAAILTTVFVGFSLLAQGQGGPRLYDPSMESTLQGSVTAVNTVTGRHGWNGIHFTLQSSGQSYDVHVGPSAYLERHGFVFAEGDQVEVVGSKVDMSGTATLIAREIKKDGKILTLRDRQGIPLWSGGPRTAQ
ncbi:MAG TPA: hypothetical protein VGR47_06955 [Terracidiphilus sp.]|nr:hypothetical protein [Terracidiphilus sp.]